MPSKSDVFKLQELCYDIRDIVYDKHIQDHYDFIYNILESFPDDNSEEYKFTVSDFSSIKSAILTNLSEASAFYTNYINNKDPDIQRIFRLRSRVFDHINNWDI